MPLKIEREVNVESEPCVLAWDEKLFVGTEDGFIKSFDAQLSPGVSWSAHASQLFALDAAGDKVYSASNDGGVRVWSAQGLKICDFPHSDGDIEALYVYGTNVFTGDEVGNVTVYENSAVKAKYNVLEEVKDLQYSPPFLFTGRDLYVTITEIKLEESKNRFMTRHTIEGRAPIRIAGDRLFLVARNGNNLKMHYATMDEGFKQLHEVKVSDMIITSLSVNSNYVWTGGWDGYIRRWKIANDQLEPAGEIALGACVNALITVADTVYAAMTGGKVIHITVV